MSRHAIFAAKSVAMRTWGWAAPRHPAALRLAGPTALVCDIHAAGEVTERFRLRYVCYTPRLLGPEIALGLGALDPGLVAIDYPNGYLSIEPLGPPK